MNLAHLECTFAEVPNAAKAIMLPAYRSMLKPTPIDAFGADRFRASKWWRAATSDHDGPVG
jgi:hypothetical protein